jgi:hypothetical protein
MLRLFGVVLAAWLVAAPSAAAPTPQEAEVIAAMQRFFDAMAAQDAAGLQAAVMPGSMFTAVRVGPDKTRRVSRLTIEQFVASLRPGLHEAMWSPQVSLRGDMIATLRAPYEFRLDGKTTHCGIDVFDFAKVDGAWKIVGGVWTAEPDACPELKARR